MNPGKVSVVCYNASLYHFCIFYETPLILFTKQIKLFLIKFGKHDRMTSELLDIDNDMSLVKLKKFKLNSAPPFNFIYVNHIFEFVMDAQIKFLPWFAHEVNKLLSLV